MEEDFHDVFRRYVPKSEVDALKAELAERAKAAEDRPAETEGSAAPGASGLDGS